MVQKRRLEDASRYQLAQAWHTANFMSRVMGGGKLPALETVIASAPKRSRLSLRAQLEVVSKLTGLPLVVHG